MDTKKRDKVQAERRKAYREMLQAESLLNKKMDTYIERKKTEIRNDINRGKDPNFNSVKRSELVTALRDELIKVKDRDIAIDPLSALKDGMKIEEKRRANTENPLNYEEFRRSAFNSFYSKCLLDRYNEHRLANKTQEGLDIVAKGMKTATFRKNLDEMENAIKGTAFDNYMKTNFSRYGGMVFNPERYGMINRGGIDSIRDSLNTLKNGLETKEGVEKYDKFVSIVNMLGFKKVLEAKGVKLQSSNEIFEERNNINNIKLDDI